MGLSPKSNYEKKIVSCFDIGEVPRSPEKRNWNWLYFLPFIFTFEQGALVVAHDLRVVVAVWAVGGEIDGFLDIVCR